MNDEELLRDVLDPNLSLHRRLSSLKALTTREGDGDSVTETLNAVLAELATNLGYEPELAYVAGCGIARTMTRPPTSLMHSLTPEASGGWLDETQRIESRQRGEVIDYSRLSDAETWERIRVARSAGYAVERRIEAAVELGDAAEDEEVHAIHTLRALAISRDTPQRLLEGVGLGYARLRLRQGIFEDEFVGAFQESATAAFLREASVYREEWNRRGVL